jgi:hypothetical protein
MQTHTNINVYINVTQINMWKMITLLWKGKYTKLNLIKDTHFSVTGILITLLFIAIDSVSQR